MQYDFILFVLALILIFLMSNQCFYEPFDWKENYASANTIIDTSGTTIIQSNKPSLIYNYITESPYWLNPLDYWLNPYVYSTLYGGYNPPLYPSLYNSYYPSYNSYNYHRISRSHKSPRSHKSHRSHRSHRSHSSHSSHRIK